ncbi:MULTISPECIES: phosphoribosyltransferase domain-containing protein [Arthrobacter]|uniref:phosphoribosyltransferase domain-containing protein n=1 Tax=Arthrobacter TaxID=1663 RepID=UPI000A55A39B|nr:MULTISPECIES: phosphoribosyltransferase domain-containing protein [Arthrobacter]
MSGRPSAPWSGGFLASGLDVRIHSDPASTVAVADLVGLALRRNPKRAHLLVSQVLAKHIPTEPALVIAAGELLGALVAQALAGAGQSPSTTTPPLGDYPPLQQAAAQLAALLTPGTLAGLRPDALGALTPLVAGLRTPVPEAVVIGYAETATGLGRLVANALGAYYIHSTRHATPGLAQAAGFQEGHSHATSHRLVPTDPHWLDGNGPVILVDDELSTGSTVINTIRELHALVPHSTYVVAALIDLRSAPDRERFDALAAELDCRISVVALGTGSIELGSDILDRAAELIDSLPQDSAPAAQTARSGHLSLLEFTAADIIPIRSDRFGNAAPPPQETVATVAGAVSDHLRQRGTHGPVVVVGTEENMFVPLAIAAELDTLRPDAGVRFSTTTRSPIVPIDRDDYAIAGALTFASHDLTADGPGIRFAYNLTGTGRRPGTIVVFPEPGTDTDAVMRGTAPDLPGLAPALQAAADHVVVVLLPADYPTPQPSAEEIP